jgi:hypothetical protein
MNHGWCLFWSDSDGRQGLKIFPNDSYFLILKASATEKQIIPLVLAILFWKQSTDQNHYNLSKLIWNFTKTLGIRAAVSTPKYLINAILLSMEDRLRYGSILGKLNFNRRWKWHTSRIWFVSKIRTICLRKYWFKYISLSWPSIRCWIYNPT